MNTVSSGLRVMILFTYQKSAGRGQQMVASGDRGLRCELGMSTIPSRTASSTTRVFSASTSRCTIWGLLYLQSSCGEDSGIFEELAVL